MLSQSSGKKVPIKKENYRPVSLLSRMQKAFEKIMSKQINNFMKTQLSTNLCRFPKTAVARTA